MTIFIIFIKSLRLIALSMQVSCSIVCKLKEEVQRIPRAPKERLISQKLRIKAFDKCVILRLPFSNNKDIKMFVSNPTVSCKK